MKRFIYLSAVVIFISACKKGADTTGSNPGDDGCVEKAASGNGEIKANQYIVAFNSSINGRTASRISLDEISKGVLQRHAINVSSLKNSFPGEPGGFIATMSASDAEALRHDEAVSIVEPDRIISLGNCFTVVEPRLVTWNITRVGYGNGIGKTAWIVDSGVDFENSDLTVDQTRSRSFL